MEQYFVDTRQEFLKLVFVVVAIVSLMANIIFFNSISGRNSSIDELQSDISEIKRNYQITMNVSSVIRGYYYEALENIDLLSKSYDELQEYYTEVLDYSQWLEDECLVLQEINDSLLAEIESVRQEKEIIQNELLEISQFEKIEVLEENSDFIISANGNITLIYNLTYSGFITVSFTASSELFLWVGSSISNDVYYTRYPISFPQIAKEGEFVLPACQTLYIFLSNPSELSDVELTLSLMYTY